MELTYTIKRSGRRRKLTISVERDRSVIVHAPASMSDSEIREYVDAKRQWLHEKVNHPQKYSELPHPPGKELVNGEAALYLGSEYPIHVDRAATAVVFDHRFIVPSKASATRKAVLREWYVAQAHELLIPRVAQHARGLGVTFSEVRVVDDRYRWGSCTVRNVVRINWRLIKAPMFVIDYVIVHELAHLLELNHTERFWNIVRTQAPSAEKARVWLKRHGQLLEEDI